MTTHKFSVISLMALAGSMFASVEAQTSLAGPAPGGAPVSAATGSLCGPGPILGMLPSSCAELHDGVAEDALGVSPTQNGAMGWMVYEDCLLEIEQLEVAFGFTDGMDGIPVALVVYDDPNDDADPGDAVLLHYIPIPGGTMNSNTGIMNVFDFTALLGAPIPGAGGMYFGCVCEALPAGVYPGAMDTSAPDLGRNWFFGALDPFPLDVVTPSNNMYYDLEETVNPADYLITASGTPMGGGEPGVQYCPGDGVAPHTPCPCYNNNGSMGGCVWDFSFPTGGVLTATGDNDYSPADVYLWATNVSNDFGIFFGADNRTNGGNGNPFGCGLRCAGGNLVRLTPPTMVTNNTTSCGPVETLDTAASPGTTRRYQYWFRTPGCCSGGMSNLTNGYEIMWQ